MNFRIWLIAATFLPLLNSARAEAACTRANYVSVDGSAKQGAITNPGASAEFCTTIQTEDYYVIKTDPQTISGTSLELFGPNCPTCFLANDEDDGLSSSLIIQKLQPGSLTMMVSGASPAALGSFEIKVQRVSELTLAGPLISTLPAQDSDVWTTFTIDDFNHPDVIVGFDIEVEHLGGAPVLALLYGPDCTLPECFDGFVAINATNQSAKFSKFLFKGDYHVRLFSYSGAATVRLSLINKIAKGTPPEVLFLSRFGGTQSNFTPVSFLESQSQQYYDDIGARIVRPSLHDWPTTASRETLDGFKELNGFHSTLNEEVTAYYYNAGDLGLGREMHCKKTELFGQADHFILGCYVSNYGDGAGGSPEVALAQTINPSAHTPLATVAMEFFSSAAAHYYANYEQGAPVTADYEPVKFYVYDSGGQLSTNLQLDNEGAKYVPGVCHGCHMEKSDYPSRIYGAVEPAHTNKPVFLPFDGGSFEFSRDPGFTLSAQSESLRKLNALVMDTGPIQGIKDYIDLVYGTQGGASKVYNTGTIANWDQVEDSYINAGDSDWYEDVYRPYCRGCHMATDLFDFSNPAVFKSAFSFRVCPPPGNDARSMPHAEVPFKKFWASEAPQMIETELGLDCDPVP